LAICRIAIAIAIAIVIAIAIAITISIAIVDQPTSHQPAEYQVVDIDALLFILFHLI